MFKKSILMLLLITASSFANCEKPMSQSEMNECSSSKFDIADKELNDIYKELMSKLNDTEKNNLKKEQRKWIKYRNAEASRELKELGLEGGSMASMMYGDSLTYSTKKRVEELKALLAKYK